MYDVSMVYASLTFNIQVFNKSLYMSLHINRGSYMSAHVLLNFLNELEKKR